MNIEYNANSDHNDSFCLPTASPDYATCSLYTFFLIRCFSILFFLYNQI